MQEAAKTYPLAKVPKIGLRAVQTPATERLGSLKCQFVCQVVIPLRFKTGVICNGFVLLVFFKDYTSATDPCTRDRFQFYWPNQKVTSWSPRATKDKAELDFDLVYDRIYQTFPVGARHVGT